jgi:hypothetical protein
VSCRQCGGGGGGGWRLFVGAAAAHGVRREIAKKGTRIFFLGLDDHGFGSLWEERDRDEMKEDNQSQEQQLAHDYNVFTILPYLVS